MSEYEPVSSAVICNPWPNSEIIYQERVGYTDLRDDSGKKYT